LIVILSAWLIGIPPEPTIREVKKLEKEIALWENFACKAKFVSILLRKTKSILAPLSVSGKFSRAASAASVPLVKETIPMLIDGHIRKLKARMEVLLADKLHEKKEKNMSKDKRGENDRRRYYFDGYDHQGYDRQGYDRDGYNRYGYCCDRHSSDEYPLIGKMTAALNFEL
jgi:hypothetical protein